MEGTVVLLDIDGVLNEAQQPITLCMQQKLQQLARHRDIYFVTGNSYTKSVDLLNGPIGMFAGIFCNGAEELRTMRGKLVWQDTESPVLPQMQMIICNYLSGQQNNSIDWRTPRMVNVSRVGRFASKEQRKLDKAEWRDKFISLMKSAFPQIECSKGGAISVDIYSKGADKSRAGKWINNTGRNFVFIGDKTDEGGNDYPMKLYCDENTKSICLTSNGPKHTMDLLDDLLGRV